MPTYNDSTTPTVHDDRVVDSHNTNWSDGFARTLAGLALLLAIVALAVGWMAYNRTGEELEDRIQESISRGAESTIDTTQDATQDTTETMNPTTNPNPNPNPNPDGVIEDDTNMQQ